MGSRGESTDAGTIPEQVVTDLLDSRRRCRLLAELRASDGEMLVDDLAAAIGSAEEGCTPSEVDESTLEEMRHAIFDRHIPKLTAIGVVEYDSMLDRLRLQLPEVAARAAAEVAEGDGNDVSKEK